VSSPRWVLETIFPESPHGAGDAVRTDVEVDRRAAQP
jgi:hypothetical protein